MTTLDFSPSGFSLGELRILRNAVFARHGRPFKSTELDYYFYAPGSAPCGVPFDVSQSYSDDALSGRDKLNIDELLALQDLAERRASRTSPSLEQFQGEWLNRVYVEGLRQTRSPGQAYIPGTALTGFTISRESGAGYFDWKQALSYHEGVFSPARVKVVVA